MTARAQTMLGVMVLGVGLGLAAAVLQAGDERYPADAPAERMLYLTSGRTANWLMLSFDAVASDVYWIRTIQHYGRDRKSNRTTGRYELLQPLLELTTTLDPHFMIAYRFGAVFLALAPPTGAGRVDQAIALLQKGLRNDPERWQYALDIGFVHYWHTGDYAAAGAWFKAASDMPRAPIWLKNLAAMTLTQGGDRAGARQLLTNLATSEEPWIRQAAERGLMQIRVLDDLDQLQVVIDRYDTDRHGRPSSWRELVSARLLAGDPRDPAGVAYEIDPVTGRAMLSARSPLNPLPALPVRR